MLCVRPNDCPHCRMRETLVDEGLKRKWDALMTALRVSPVDTSADFIVARAKRIENANYEQRAVMMLSRFKKGYSTKTIASAYRISESEVLRLLDVARSFKKVSV